MRKLPSISTMGFWTLTLSTVVELVEAKHRMEELTTPMGKERLFLKKTRWKSLGLEVIGRLGLLKANDDDEEETAAVTPDMTLR